MTPKSSLARLIVSAISVLLSGSAAAEDMMSAPAPDPGMEFCYGIAKKGQNACATARHKCAGGATRDRDPDEWVEVAVGSCVSKGGALKPAATPASN